MTHLTVIPNANAKTLDSRDAKVAEFLGQESGALREILDLLGEFEASEAVLDLVGLCTGPRPDARAIRCGLETVLNALEAMPFSVIDHAAYASEGPRDLHAAIRWYGSRISDISRGFRG